jgi:adenylate kinase
LDHLARRAGMRLTLMRRCQRRCTIADKASASNQMRLLLIGAPGAGKGTQAERLAERFGITHISSGDLLRQHVKDQTSIGHMIKSYVDRGDLVPDGVVMDMLRKPVVAATQAGGYVLDGFPRTVEQARAAFPTAHALGVEVRVAVHLDVARAELARRLLARRRGSEDTDAVIERRRQVYVDKKPFRCWSTTKIGNGCSPWMAPSRRMPCTRTSSPACADCQTSMPGSGKACRATAAERQRCLLLGNTRGFATARSCALGPAVDNSIRCTLTRSASSRLACISR